MPPIVKISIKVKPNARHEQVEPKEPGPWLVSVKGPPIEGRANARVIQLLASHFGVSKSKVRIKLGQKARTKVFEVELPIREPRGEP